MLSNEERLEKLKQAASQPVIETQSEQTPGNILSFVVPTEHVQLPSKGLFYHPEHPLYKQLTIEIKQMTTKEEDILTNKSLIKKGTVIERLLESLIVDKRIPASSLLVGDRNAIILAARAAGYGEDYEITTTCTACSTKKNININLISFLEQQNEKLESKFNNIDDETARLPNGNLVITLPKTNWIVECRLLTGKDEVYLLNLAEIKRKSSLNEEITIAEQMALMVESIQLVTDRGTVLEAIKKMPASDAKYLRRKYQEMSPTFDMKIDFDCDVCGLQQETEVGFNQEFFWPKR
jgi:hypothetical protein